MIIRVFVPGTPKPQPRVRHSTHVTASGKRFSAIYTPDSAEAWKAAVATFCADAVLAHAKYIKGRPLEVNLMFLLPRPKGHYDRHGNLKASAPRWHLVKPDKDNLEKAILDSLTMVGMFDDDAVVVQGTTIKRWVKPDERPGCHIHITTLDILCKQDLEEL